MGLHKSKITIVQDPNGAVHHMPTPNAMDMVHHVKGWKLIGELPENICDACLGTGKFPAGTDETCWHCEGEGLDPTK